MGMDYSNLPFSKGAPRVLAATSKRAAADKALRDAYAAVDARDKRTCRVTGATLVAGHVDPRMRLERHHLVKRSASKSGIGDPRNIVTVSAAAHQLLESHALECQGTNADGRLVFTWNRRMVAPSQEPFVIRSKRKSQREAEE